MGGGAVIEPPNVSLSKVVTEKRSVFSWDGMTHNMTEMAKWAGVLEACWMPEEIEGVTAAKLIPFLEAGLHKLKTQPEEAKKFNPPNGWGDYEGFVEFVEKYLAACREHPDATIKVSR